MTPIVPSAHELILLEALRRFIVPEAEAVADLQRDYFAFKTDLKSSAPEAMKLIMALRNFISSIVEGAALPKNPSIEVELDVDPLASEDKSNKYENDEETTDKPTLHSPSSQSDDDSNIPSNVVISQGPSSASDLTFHAKVLRELREHVFNKMPIRLLRFIPKGSKLEISLIERNSIYEHLVTIMEGHRHEPDYRATQADSWGERFTETQVENIAIHRVISKYAGYAILSHTWLRAFREVTFRDWKTGVSAIGDPGYQKLVNFCRTAWKSHGLTLGWMDTVCIDKDSSSELDESIRSMFNWYERSKVCIVYLAETELLGGMRFDPWFTRGWTLQELLAPRVVKFYNRNWRKFQNTENDKQLTAVTRQIEVATTISVEELNNIRAFRVPLSRRMQLAASRQVTREEDMAYSLMGIFNVSITTAYGEGAERAFYRLIQEILNTTSFGVMDLFNCAGESYFFNSELIPTNPRQYLNRSLSINLQMRPLDPLNLTHLGLRIHVLLMPGVSVNPLLYTPRGDFGATANISPLGIHKDIPTTYRLLDNTVLGPDSNEASNLSTRHQYTFAVFNIKWDGNGAVIPPKCIAIMLRCEEDAGTVTSSGDMYRIFTEEPVVFDMQVRNRKQNNKMAEDYMCLVGDDVALVREDLEKHGLQHVFMYL